MPSILSSHRPGNNVADLEAYFLQQTCDKLAKSLTAADRLGDFLRGTALLVWYYFAKGRIAEAQYHASGNVYVLSSFPKVSPFIWCDFATCKTSKTGILSSPDSPYHIGFFHMTGAKRSHTVSIFSFFSRSSSKWLGTHTDAYFLFQLSPRLVRLSLNLNSVCPSNLKTPDSKRNNFGTSYRHPLFPSPLAKYVPKPSRARVHDVMHMHINICNDHRRVLFRLRVSTSSTFQSIPSKSRPTDAPITSSTTTVVSISRRRRVVRSWPQ